MCSLFFLYKYDTLGNSHSLSFLLPASLLLLGGPKLSDTVTSFILKPSTPNVSPYNLYLLASSANAAPLHHPHLQTSCPHSAHCNSSLCTFPTLSCFWLFFYTSSSLFLIELTIFQWNTEGLRTRIAELLHFISLDPVDLIYTQESNLNSFSSFRIHGYSALRFARTH